MTVIMYDAEEIAKATAAASVAKTWYGRTAVLPVLDKGSIRLVDCMGDDRSIVRAARVSHGEGSKGLEADAKLIAYMMKNKHTTPFEHVTLTVHVKCPIFVARQWMRHRTGSFNEISARYTEMADDFYVPDADQIRQQGNKDKQAGVTMDDPLQAQLVVSLLASYYKNAYGMYQDLLDGGVAREQARMVLPVALYTEFYWTVNLHNLYHFLTLRLDPHAQYEIREYAQVLLEIARHIAPLATAAYEGTENGE